MPRELSLMVGFKTPFNDDQTWSVSYVPHDVPVSRKRRDKRPNELIADGFLPLHERARNLKHHVFRVVRHNPVEVGSSPGVVVLMDKRFDVSNRRCGRRGYGCPFIPRLFAYGIASRSTREQQVPALCFFDSWLHEFVQVSL